MTPDAERAGPEAGPLIFWRDGATIGRSGYWVRAVSLNEVVPRWVAEGRRVVGIRLAPENGSNVDVLVEDEEVPHA